MRLVKYPSLELNWLPNSVKKTLSLPRIAFTTSQETAGVYLHLSDPSCRKFWYEGVNIAKRPLICISEELTDDDILPGIIAHEYKHHEQKYNFRMPKASSFAVTRDEDYVEQVRHYFVSQSWEMDALRFQHKVSPDAVSDYWMDLVQAR